MTPSVTFTGTEVALLAGVIARALSVLDEEDFDVVDLMLERTLAAMPQPVSPELMKAIEARRVAPLDRYWNVAIIMGSYLDRFTDEDFGKFAGIKPSAAFLVLLRLAETRPELKHHPRGGWQIVEADRAG